MASENVPTTRGQQMAQPLSQATNQIVPTTRGQPLTATHSQLGEVPAVRSLPTTNVPGILMTEPTNAIVHSSRSSQLMSGERHISSTLDDTAIIKQILSTHAPDGREFDVKPLLIIIQDIMYRTTPTSHAVIIYKCSAGEDANLITIALFRSLSSYSWEAKAAIAFAAFAVSYAEFWLVAQFYTTNPLAKSVVVLKGLPEIMEPTEALEQKFEAVNNLMKAILDVTECIIKFKELFSQPEMESAVAHILIAVYWTVRCIVTCSITLLNLIALGHKYVAEALELNSLAHKLAGIKKDLERQMALINQKIEEMSQNDAFLELILLSETPHIDNMKILRALIYGKEDQLPLYDGTQKRRASLDILRRKHVLLFISDLELPYKELEILRLAYVEPRQHPTRVERQYEVVWLPVVDRLSPWQEEKQKQFELVQNSMPWYSVARPMMIGPAVIRFIKEIWGFNKKPQLVVLDPQGTSLYEKLQNLFKQIHVDNQAKLQMLIPFADNFPLKDCSSNEMVLSSTNSLSGDTDETDVVDQKMVLGRFPLPAGNIEIWADADNFSSIFYQILCLLVIKAAMVTHFRSCQLHQTRMELQRVAYDGCI
ncbi:hypothetical protein ACH5RR_030769 [Cinchona calisaya]|uniref:Sieve element occlusion N-terminal domain-containing protein n=1 Tax=Cinchona calisaya TaxID=153742 RepID=A0ABD2Z0Q1_9GENT